MPRTRNPYPADFRAQIIALARAGRGVESLAREFEPCAATIAGWLNYVIPIDRTASATDRPFDTRTSTCRGFATISLDLWFSRGILLP